MREIAPSSILGRQLVSPLTSFRGSLSTFEPGSLNQPAQTKLLVQIRCFAYVGAFEVWL